MLHRLFPPPDQRIAKPDLIRDNPRAELLFKRIAKPETIPLFYPEGHETFFIEEEKGSCKINSAKLEEMLRNEIDIKPIVLEAYLKNKISTADTIYLFSLHDFALEYVYPIADQRITDLIKIHYENDENHDWLCEKMYSSLPHSLIDWYESRQKADKLKEFVSDLLTSIEPEEKYFTLIPAALSTINTLSETCATDYPDYQQELLKAAKKITQLLEEDADEIKSLNIQDAIIPTFFFQLNIKRQIESVVEINSLFYPRTYIDGHAYFFLPSAAIQEALRKMYRDHCPVSGKHVESIPMFGVLEAEDIVLGFLGSDNHCYRPKGQAYKGLNPNREIHGGPNPPPVSYIHDYLYHAHALEAAESLCPDLLELMRTIIKRMNYLTGHIGNLVSFELSDFGDDISRFKRFNTEYAYIIYLAFDKCNPHRQSISNRTFALREYAFLLLADMMLNKNHYLEYINANEYFKDEDFTPDEFMAKCCFYLSEPEHQLLLEWKELSETKPSVNSLTFCLCLHSYSNVPLDQLKIFASKLAKLESSESIEFKWNKNDGMMLNFKNEKLSFRFCNAVSKKPFLEPRLTRVYPPSEYTRLFSHQNDWLRDLGKTIDANIFQESLDVLKPRL